MTLLQIKSNNIVTKNCKKKKTIANGHKNKINDFEILYPYNWKSDLKI